MSEPLNTAEGEQSGEQQKHDEKHDEKSGDTPDLAAELAKWQALARKHEARAKENHEKAQQFDKLSEAQKSELQKAIERAEKAEKLAAEVQSESLRLAVALDKKVPANLIHGSTKEELEACADALIAFRAESGKGEKPADFGGGNRGKDVGTKVKQLTREQLAQMRAEGKYAEIIAAQKAGACDSVMKGE